MPSRHARSATVRPEESLAAKRGAVERPSTWPRTSSVRSPSRTMNSENLMLDEPALMTAIASAMPSSARRDRRGLLPPRIGHERHDGRGREAVLNAVGAAGQHDGDARAEHDPRAVGAGEGLQLLVTHVGGLTRCDAEDVGLPV